MPSGHTPTPTNVTGTATPIPNGMTPEQRMTQRWQQQHIQPPAGWSVDESTNTVVKDENFLLQHPWLFPLMGIGAGAALAGMGVGGAAAGAGAAGGAGAGGAGAAGGAGVGVHMAAAGAAASWPTAASTIAQVFAQIYGANAQTNSSEYAALLQSQSAAAALAFAREQAARDAAQNAQIQRANYDQWAAGSQNSYAQSVADATNARNLAVQGGHNTYNAWAAHEGRVGQLGEVLGLGPRYTPPYEELPPLQIPSLTIPSYAGPGSTGTSGTGTTGRGQNFDPSYIDQQVRSTLARYGVQPSGRGTGPGDVANWVDYITKSVNGWEPYWSDRIGQEIGRSGH